ncbi:MAG: GDSL-type esterase/lipase family protein [Nanoarchaeota archaeon]
MTRILVFGDSIEYGAWDIEGGWVQRLRNFLDKRIFDSNFEDYFVLYNLGVSGDTAADIIKRFESETKARIKPDEGDIVIIISVGGNDSVFVHETKTTDFTPEEFKNNLEKIINLARKYSDKIVLKGEIPVDESKADPIPWSPGYSYKEKHTKEFNDIIKSVAKENNVYFIDVYEKFEKADYKKLLADGCHPTAEGHELIFNIVKDYLVENKIL